MAAGVEFSDMNWMGFAIAFVVAMVLGFLWYSPKMPTGRIWMRDMKMPMDHKPAPGEMMRGMVLMILGTVLMLIVFMHILVAFRDAYRVDGSRMGGDGLGLMDGLQGGLWMWLGFALPFTFAGVAWEGKPWSLFFVNAGYYLVQLLLAGIILVTVGGDI